MLLDDDGEADAGKAAFAGDAAAVDHAQRDLRGRPEDEGSDRVVQRAGRIGIGEIEGDEVGRHAGGEGPDVVAVEHGGTAAVPGISIARRRTARTTRDVTLILGAIPQESELVEWTMTG